jgi:hypothetical protein
MEALLMLLTTANIFPLACAEGKRERKKCKKEQNFR